MTIIVSTTARPRPAGHAYVVPVVREVAPPPIDAGPTVW